MANWKPRNKKIGIKTNFDDLVFTLNILFTFSTFI